MRESNIAPRVGKAELLHKSIYFSQGKDIKFNLYRGSIYMLLKEMER